MLAFFCLLILLFWNCSTMVTFFPIFVSIVKFYFSFMNCDNRSNNHWIVLSPVASYLIIYNRTNSSESRHNSLLHSRLAGRFCSIMKCVPSISLYYPFCKHATSCTPFASSLFCRLIPFSIYFSSRASIPPPFPTALSRSTFLRFFFLHAPTILYIPLQSH